MTNLMLTIKVKKYIRHKTLNQNMKGEVKLNENSVLKIRNNKAEIVVDNEYKLIIIIEKERVIAKYSNVSLIIEYNKFNAEKIAKKIFQIVQQTHKFSVLTIRKALQLLILDRFISEVIGTEKGENTELLKQVIELLSKS